MSYTTLTEKQIHLAGRIDQVVRDYFAKRTSPSTIAAMNLMELFVKKGIFENDADRKGKPIRDFLRELDAANKLELLHHCRVIRKPVNRNWYFSR